MWSIDVGIQRRTDGHKDLRLDTVVVDLEDGHLAMLICSAIFIEIKVDQINEK